VGRLLMGGGGFSLVYLKLVYSKIANSSLNYYSIIAIEQDRAGKKAIADELTSWLSIAPTQNFRPKSSRLQLNRN
jgi:hypothetical protein